MALRKMFALSLVLQPRLETARKWPITLRNIQPIANGHFFRGKLFIYLFPGRTQVLGAVFSQNSHQQWLKPIKCTVGHFFPI